MTEDKKNESKKEDKKMSGGGGIHQKATLHLLAGGAGAAIGQCLTSPLDVVQTRLQSTHLNFSNAASMNAIIGSSNGLIQMRPTYFHILCGYMRHMVLTEGISSLFKGLSPSLFGIVPIKSLYFFTYNEAKYAFSQKKVFHNRPHLMHSSSAVVAQTIVGTVTNPVWYIKTKLQLNRKTSSSVFRIITTGYKKHGFKCFFRGLSATYVGVLESVIYFVIYEELKRKLKLNNRRKAGESFQPVTLVCATLLSKITATATMYPHEVIRTRLRQDVRDERGRLKYRNFIQALMTVAKEEGRSGVYGGFGTSLVRQLPYTAVIFITYEGIIFLVDQSDY